MQQQQQQPPAPLIHPNLTAQEQTHAAGAVVVPIPPGTELLALQIQAFLRASQDEELDGAVVIDEDVIKDILDVLSGSGFGSVGDGSYDVGEDDVSAGGQAGVMEDEGNDDDSDCSGELGDLTCEGGSSLRDILEGQDFYAHAHEL
jgi:hypothetical protein